MAETCVDVYTLAAAEPSSIYAEGSAQAGPGGGGVPDDEFNTVLSGVELTEANNVPGRDDITQLVFDVSQFEGWTIASATLRLFALFYGYEGNVTLSGQWIDEPIQPWEPGTVIPHFDALDGSAFTLPVSGAEGGEFFENVVLEIPLGDIARLADGGVATLLIEPQLDTGPTFTTYELVAAASIGDFAEEAYPWPEGAFAPHLVVCGEGGVIVTPYTRIVVTQRMIASATRPRRGAAPEDIDDRSLGHTAKRYRDSRG